MSKKHSSCYYCGGEVVSQTKDVDFRWKGELFVVKDAPIFNCKQCGETYYSASVSEQFDRIASKKAKATTFLKVPVFDWNAFGKLFPLA